MHSIKFKRKSQVNGNQSELYYIYTTLKPNGKLSGKSMGSTKSGKKNCWKCDSQELLKEKLFDYFVHHYARTGSLS